MDKFFNIKKWKSNFSKGIFILTFFTCQSFFSQTTWTVVSTSAPDSSGALILLLSDGSVLCKTTNGGTDRIGNGWNKLTPNSSGSYLNGTWTRVASMNDTRLYFSTQVLKDGRLYVAGGEYGTGGSLSEIYDPASNSWTALNGPNAYLGDANSTILDDGRILQASLVTPYNKTKIYDPVTNVYINGPTCLGNHDEATWIKLPDNSILFININSTNAERYIPSLNQWITDATVPVNLYDPFGYETGPAFLLPNGKVFFMGSLGNTAIYTPSGNNTPGTWITGPTIPGGNGMPDAAGAMMVDGKIIFTAGPIPVASNSVFLTPTFFYEYDYVANSYTQVNAPGGGPTLNDTAFNSVLLDLPDGSVMMSEYNTKNYYIHAPTGAPLVAGKPTITTVAQAGCSNTFTLTGLLFNGISAGACYGDDWQMNTNFPIVRLTSGTNVYYARTYKWNHTGVQTGSLPDTTLFSLPPNIPNGTYSLSVIANGNASNPITFTFTPFPALTSLLITPDICSGNTFTYNAIANMTNTTMMWTRATVAGISNAAITTPQSSNPNEVLINTTNVAKTAVYAYTLTNGSCVTNYFVSVVVNPKQTITFTGNNVICQNASTTLHAIGINTFTWSTGTLSNSITVSPATTTVYTASGYNAYGCLSTGQLTVTVQSCVGLKENTNNATINCIVYPNPFSGKLTIENLIEKPGNYSIKIYDVFGRVIKEEEHTFSAGKNKKEIELNDVAKGVYMLTLQKGNDIFKTRVIKE